MARSERLSLKSQMITSDLCFEAKPAECETNIDLPKKRKVVTLSNECPEAYPCSKSFTWAHSGAVRIFKSTKSKHWSTPSARCPSPLQSFEDRNLPWERAASARQCSSRCSLKGTGSSPEHIRVTKIKCSLRIWESGGYQQCLAQASQNHDKQLLALNPGANRTCIFPQMKDVN